LQTHTELKTLGDAVNVNIDFEPETSRSYGMPKSTSVACHSDSDYWFSSYVTDLHVHVTIVSHS